MVLFLSYLILWNHKNIFIVMTFTNGCKSQKDWIFFFNSLVDLSHLISFMRNVILYIGKDSLVLQLWNIDKIEPWTLKKKDVKRLSN